MASREVSESDTTVGSSDPNATVKHSSRDTMAVGSNTIAHSQTVAHSQTIAHSGVPITEPGTASPRSTLARATTEAMQDGNDRLEPARPDYTDFVTVDPTHYSLTSEIARGGMGRIMVARDLRLGRDVAVKEILDDSPDMLRRFEREIRITARLQHPSIVSVHEAGRWPSGEPFYAMKLVQGKSLDTIIGTTPTLDGRLAQIPAVLAVADAMAYSHRERVIHRDLKPQNVIVGDFGETVVLDWGLAKELDGTDIMTSGAHRSQPKPGQTSAGEILGTLGYMPPEQANGEPVDERADVYAIGAILYHLLTGQPPFTGINFGELFYKVRETKPEPIAKLEPAAPPDLVAIAERAMHRDRDVRYPTAKELADDIRRFQTGQLVGAHRYSLRELLGRWARRHAPVLAAAGVAIVVIAVGSVLAVRQIIDERERVAEKSLVAEKNRKDAEALMSFMLHDMRSKLFDVGRLDILETPARRAARYFDEHRGNDTEEDRISEAQSHVQIGEVLNSKGDRAAANAEIDKGRELAKRVPETSPMYPAAQMIVVDTSMLIGRDALVLGNTALAMQHFESAHDVASAMYAKYPTDRLCVLEKAKAASELAGVVETRGDPKRAMTLERDIVAMLEKIPAKLDGDIDRILVSSYAHLGSLLYADNHVDEALVEERKSLAIAEQEVTSKPSSLTWLWHLSNNYDEIGKMLRYKKDLAGAEASFRAGMEIGVRLSLTEPNNIRYLHGLAVGHESLGDLALDRGDLATAADEYAAAMAIEIKLTEGDPTNTSFARDLSVDTNKLGDVHAKRGDAASAAAAYRKSLAIRDRLATVDPKNQGWKRERWYSHYKLAFILAAMHQVQGPIDELRAGLPLAVELGAAKPDNESTQTDLANTHAALSGLLMDDDKPAARDHLAAALAIAKRMATKPGVQPKWAKMAEAWEKDVDQLSRAASSPQRPPKRR